MDKMKNYDFLNSPLMTPEEFNFILLEPAVAEIHSSNLKKGVRSEMVDILKNDLTGTLLLPFRRTETQ
ncbi:MAG: hypothetical protein WA974_13185 [Thermodesulfobacteriota bacterium]|jgi:hypothetical protein